jgi:hypothetical protein
MKYVFLSLAGLSSCSLLVTLLKPPFPDNFKCGNKRADAGEFCFDTLDTGSVGNFTSVSLGDLDGDGQLDIITTSTGDNDITTTHFKGDGNFSHGSNPAQNPFQAAVGEFSGDELNDLAVVTQTQVEILRSIALDTFSLGDGDGSGVAPLAVEAGAFDSTPGDDILVANSQGDDVSFFHVDSNGQLILVDSFPVGDLPIYIAKADLEGDGDLDFAVLNQNSADVSVFRNDGAITTSLGEFFMGGSSFEVAFADFNGDSFADLATVDGSVLRVSFQTNGAFSPPITLQPGGFLLAVASGDFDGDSIQDIATVNFNQDPATTDDVTIFLGDTEGTFAVSSIFNTAKDGASDLAAGDINQDGVDDLAIIHDDGSLVALLSNP